MESKEGRRIHGLAWQAGENGDFEEALQQADSALLAYQREGDYLGLSEIIAQRSIFLRNLSNQLDEPAFLYLAKAEMTEAVRIARKFGNADSLTLPLYNLAKLEEELGDYQEGISHYQEAIDSIHIDPNIKPDSQNPAHNRPAVLADMKVHLSGCEYKAGDKLAIKRLEQALEELQTAVGASDYERAVWVSGGHMIIAEILREDNLEKAKEHLQKAKEIIDANSDLKLRKQQWEKLAKDFN